VGYSVFLYGQFLVVIVVGFKFYLQHDLKIDFSGARLQHLSHVSVIVDQPVLTANAACFTH